MTTGSPYEAGILQAVSEGRKIEWLLSAGPWTVHDVSAVLRKYQLVVHDDGSIGKADVERFDYALALALASPVEHVRTKALRARALLVDIRQHLARIDSERADEAAREQARQALYAWQAWLNEAIVATRYELKRLNPNSSASAGKRAGVKSA